MNKVHRLMSRLVPFALVAMIASLILRTLATVVAASIPYESWPVALRVTVEVLAVLGMVVCSEIILSAAAARRQVILAQMQQVEESDEYKPSPRLKGDALMQQLAILDARKKQAVARLEREAAGEMGAVRFGGAITVIYGGLFALTTVHTLSLSVIVTELLLCFSLPFVMYYFSARYRPEQHNPGETAMTATTAALDEKVRHAGKRVLSGDYDRRDVGVLEAAAPDSPVHRKMLAALTPPDANGHPELTVSEVYATYSVTDKNAKSSLRRTLRKAGEAKRVIPGTEDVMVRWDDKEGEWRVRQAALAFLFPGGFRYVAKGGQQADQGGTPGGQGADTPRTQGGQPAISKGHQAVLDDLRRYREQHPQEIDEALANISAN